MWLTCGFPDDDDVLAHHGASPVPTRTHPTVISSPIDVPAALVAVFAGTALGVVLGWWCREFAYSDSVNGVLANLGAPWVAVAFLAGAVTAHGRRSRPLDSARRHVVAGLAGALAGMVGLVVATIVYYGPARTGSFDFHGAALQTAFWTMVSVAAGIVFGAAGALWRGSAHDSVRAACLVGLGTVIAGEAGFLIAVGATDRDAFAPNVVLAVAAIGVVAPVLLGWRRLTPVCIALVAVLAVPATLATGALAVIALAVLRTLRTLPL